MIYFLFLLIPIIYTLIYGYMLSFFKKTENELNETIIELNEIKKRNDKSK